MDAHWWGCVQCRADGVLPAPVCMYVRAEENKLSQAVSRLLPRSPTKGRPVSCCSSSDVCTRLHTLHEIGSRSAGVQRYSAI